MSVDPLDTDEGPLRYGDRVKGKLHAESGVVIQAEGALVCIRIDSTGQFWSSAASLWRKDENSQ